MNPEKSVKIDPLNPEQKYLNQAANILRQGGLVIVPTETVYGIAASALNKNTLDRLYAVKQRIIDKPFSLLIDKKDKLNEFAKDIPAAAYKLIDKFWPGPLTIILKSVHEGAIGIRMPDDKIALGIIELAGVPLVCPSANLSGKPAPVDFQEAIQDLGGLVDFALDAGPTRLKIESSVVDLTVEPIKILREKAINKEDIEAALKLKTVLFICTGNSCRSVMAKAILEKKLQEKRRTDVKVFSAGIMLIGGLGATDGTKEVLKKEGINISSHRSQPVTKELIRRSDLILVMERAHEKRIIELVPEVKNRVFLLKEFAKIGDDNLDIADPIGRPLDFYERTFSVIKDAIERILDII